MRNMRYYLEDKPQYLDDPEGEYWFEKKGNGGRLYLDGELVQENGRWLV